MVKATFLIDLKEKLTGNTHYTYDQIASSALLGSTANIKGGYDETVTYNLGDKVTYMTNTGELLILVCCANGVTGSFDSTKWEEWNIMEEIQGVLDDHTIASWNKPLYRRNKVWLAIKTTSIQAYKNIYGDSAMPGLIIYDGLIISKRKPLMNQSVLWGEITEEL